MQNTRLSILGKSNNKNEIKCFLRLKSQEVGKFCRSSFDFYLNNKLHILGNWYVYCIPGRYWNQIHFYFGRFPGDTNKIRNRSTTKYKSLMVSQNWIMYERNFFLYNILNKFYFPYVNFLNLIKMINATQSNNDQYNSLTFF